jgi:hypothetical protein
MKLLITKFSPSSCHFLPLSSKYSQRSLFKLPQSVFFPEYKRPSFTPIRGKIIVLYILIFANPVAARSEARDLIARTLDRGFESRLRHGCLSASFCVVLSCVGRGLTTC